MTLQVFLLARIAEDEAAARDTDPLMPGAVFDHDVSGWWTAGRVLAECEAKRRIIAEVVPEIDEMDDRIEGEWGDGGAGPHDASHLLLRLFGLPYSGHPDYQEKWRP